MYYDLKIKAMAIPQMVLSAKELINICAIYISKSANARMHEETVA